MNTTFAPAILLDLNGIARSMPADNIVNLLHGLVGMQVLIAERGPDPDVLVEYQGSVEEVRPAHAEGIVLQLDTGNTWIVVPGMELATEPVITLFGT